MPVKKTHSRISHHFRTEPRSCSRYRTMGPRRRPKHIVFGTIHTETRPVACRPSSPSSSTSKTSRTSEGKSQSSWAMLQQHSRDSRYLEADLNRVFTEQPSPSSERRRAVELSPILDSATLLVDFHQTILASHEPFYIFPFHNPGYQWARYLKGAKSLVTPAPQLPIQCGFNVHR